MLTGIANDLLRNSCTRDVIDWLNENSGAVQAGAAVLLVLTLIAVAYQAVQTRKQADATERTVEEMREQRLSGDRPLLLIDLLDYKGNGKVPSGIKSEECYPDSMSFRVANLGPGPAIEVEMTVLHPKAHYWRSAPKGYLLKDESMAFDATESMNPPTGLSLSDCLQRCGLNVKRGHNLGFVARYRDAHGRIWVAWMCFDYDTDVDSEGDGVWWIEQGSQYVQMLKEAADAESWQALFGGPLAPQDR